jgi:two-component system response regulator AtoC
MSKILIIDDDKALCRSLQIQLEASGHEVKTSTTAKEGLAALESFTPDAVFLDIKLPDQDGLECLVLLHDRMPDLPVVIISGHQDTKATIKAMRSGAFDYLRKPFDMEDVTLLLEKIHYLSKRSIASLKVGIPDLEIDTQEIIGADKSIIDVVKKIGLLSQSRVNVLIEGESGTGKELVAKALHENTSASEPFVAINCSAVVPTLLESELFGHERGSFTGASTRKIGKLEYAGEGTVFLDEIGDMPYDLQAKLLRVLEQREFQRVGGLENIPFRARVISATNKNLEEWMEKKQFRDDLFYRLSVFRIRIPPLRERKEDIPLLVKYLINRISRRIHRDVREMEKEALDILQSYDWPGNVRELENVLTRAIALAKGPVLRMEDFQFSFFPPREKTEERQDEFVLKPLSEVEKEYIHKSLDAAGWNISKTAHLLNISPTTLRKKIHDYDLKRDRPFSE